MLKNAVKDHQLGLTLYLFRSSVDSAALISFRRALEGAVKCACNDKIKKSTPR